MQGIELAASHAPSAKRNAVLDLTADQVREWWWPVVAAMARGLTILHDECNVLLPKWIPYQTMLPPMAAILAKYGADGTPTAGVLRERVVRWFWCSVFGQAYESSPNSRGAKDVVDFGNWMQGGPPVDAVRSFRFDPAVLREVTPRQRALYRGTICLILGHRGGARDFHTQQLITTSLMQSEGIDDHHIFPADFLKKQLGIAEVYRRDGVLNRTLIDRTTNQRISNRAPSDYLAEIRNTPGFSFEQVLESHSLPMGSASPLWDDDFDRFLDWRQVQLGEAIRKVTGGVLVTNESDVA
jgi:hypothetical protein